MSEYYSVIRDNSTLSHYGIKGMRWGVKKAIESGNQKKLAKQYQKAQKKLYKLNAKADTDFQKEVAAKHNKRAAIALGVGLAGIGANAILDDAGRRAKDIVSQQSSVINPSYRRREKKYVTVGKKVEVHKVGEGLGIGPVGSEGLVGYKHPSFYPNHTITNTPGIGGTLYTHKYQNPSGSKLQKYKDIAGLVTVAGLGAAAYQTGKAIAAKRRATDKGHAKAVAKRDAWRNEMAKVFSGTQYAVRKKHK